MCTTSETTAANSFPFLSTFYCYDCFYTALSVKTQHDDILETEINNFPALKHLKSLCSPLYCTLWCYECIAQNKAVQGVAMPWKVRCSSKNNSYSYTQALNALKSWSVGCKQMHYSVWQHMSIHSFCSLPPLCCDSKAVGDQRWPMYWAYKGAGRTAEGDGQN